MRKWIALLAVSCLSLFAQAESAPNLIVHEWGTFTSFAGSDGVYIDYRPLVDSDLPDFVFDLQKQAKFANDSTWLLSKGGIITRSRMETPVMYFYSDRPVVARARVDFPHGLFTEFYPPPVFMLPSPIKSTQPPAIGHSVLEWGPLFLLPPKQAGEKVALSPVKDRNHYGIARETDSNIVRAEGPFGTRDEKFIFYRGVGNFDLPVKMQSLGTDFFTITNSGREPVSSAFLVRISDGTVRFNHVGKIEKSANVTLETEPKSLEALADAMVKDLVADGLYEKEALAMVHTWQDSWFGEDGMRLLYLLPQAFTDRELPVRVEPAPSKCVRVMVGRLETLTPEMERQIGQLIADLGSPDCAAREEAARQIRLLGRFAEPALRRSAGNAPTSELRDMIQSLLDEFRV